MKVAKTAGFCMGVQRAVNKVLDAADNRQGAVYTYGPLIHNPQVIELLERRGVKVVESTGELPSGTVLIRAHGVPPQLREEIKASATSVCDATCPRVGSVQSTIKKHIRKGYTPIIVGDAGHPEVAGLMGYSDGRGLVVNSVEEIDRLPPLEKVVVVAQTTQDEDKYKRVVQKIRSRYREVISFDTICESTHLRQEELRIMAGEVDAVVVVGGKYSGNTRRLAQISSQCGATTYHVESEQELTPELFSQARVVGVTAGASTPDWIIRRVVEKLSGMDRSRRNPFWRGLRKAFHFLRRSGIYTSLAAPGLMLTVAALTSSQVSPLLLTAGVLFIFSRQTAHNLSHREHICFTNPTDGEFLEKHRSSLAASAGIASAAALLLSSRLGLAPLIALAFAFAPGITSRLRRPSAGRRADAGEGGATGAWRKGAEITISLSWALGLAGTMAAASAVSIIPSLLTGALIFLVSYTRLHIIGLRDVQGDKMLGRMTAVARLGEKKAAAVVYRLIAVLAALPAIGAALRIFPASGYSFAALPVYLLVLMKLRRADILYPANNFLAALDAFMLLYLAAALGWFVAG